MKKAKTIAKENYIKDIDKLVHATQYEMNRILLRFQNKAFSLATKHIKTIDQIKKDAKEVKKLNLKKY